MPHLRIIDDALWQRAQDRLNAEAVPLKRTAKGVQPAFWDRRRLRHLLSGKVFCGVCGHPFSALGKDYLGCKAAMHDACRNTRRVRRATLEAGALNALGRQLMMLELVAAFVTAFDAEWRRIVANWCAAEGQRARERAAIERKIANLVEAISDGRSSPAILAKLEALEAQLAELPAEADEPVASPTSTLQEGIADVYAKKVSNLQAALTADRDPETLEAARALIETVIIHSPETDGDPPAVELIGDFIAMLQAGGVGGHPPAGRSERADPILDAFVSSGKDGPGAKP